MMKKILGFSVLLSAVVLIFASTLSYSGELQFLWSKYLDSGKVYDMEFMPDNNFFIMSNSFNTQIRNTESGELVNLFPIRMESIEFTPDSSKIINTSYYDKNDHIQIRNLNLIDLIKEYTLPDGTDTSGYNFVTTGIYFDKLIVDPIRPLIYTLRIRWGYVSLTGAYVNIQKIIIYNYETMEEVGKLTIPAEETSYYKDIAISKDGKYLVAITENTSFIKVWDLNTRQKIRDFKVCSYIPNVGGGEPGQIQFSEINPDHIYFAGKFRQSKDYVGYAGLFIYSVSKDSIIDKTFGDGLLRTWSNQFGLFDNEKRALQTFGNLILVLNFETKIWEQQINKDTITGGRIFWGYNEYSKVNNYFIGFGKNNFSCIKNNLGTSVPMPQAKSVIYPNPTSDYIEIACDNHTLKCVVEDIRIFDILGTEITTQPTSPLPLSMLGEGKIRFDVSHLAPGLYFVRVGDLVQKFVKI